MIQEHDKQAEANRPARHYPRLVQRRTPVVHTIVPLPRSIMSDCDGLRRYAEELAATSGCEVRVELSEAHHEHVTPDGTWHKTRLWRGYMAEQTVKGTVVSLDWSQQHVVVETMALGQIVLDVDAFGFEDEDSLYVGAYVEVLWTVHEEVSGSLASYNC